MDAPFLASFWADLASGLILLVIGSMLIPRYVRYLQRPNLRFGKPNSWAWESFEFVQIDKNQWRATLDLSLRNLSVITVDRLYWEIYIQKSVSVELPRAMTYPDGKEWMLTEDVGNMTRVYGYLEVPIFSMESIKFPYRINITSAVRNPVSIYYYFKTDLGQNPWWGWLAVLSKRYFLLKVIRVR